jgi:hypothetical protein
MSLRNSLLVLWISIIVAAAAICRSNWLIYSQQSLLEGRTVTGTAYFIGGRTRARTLPFRLIINRLTTPSEVVDLNAALKSGGEDDLLKALTRRQAGRIQLGNDVGVPANVIIANQEGDRTKLTVVYERYLQFSELRYGTRSSDYKFGYAELYLGTGGNEGMLIPAARIRLRDGNTWEVEDFGTFPARLMGLQVRGQGRSEIR